MAAPPNLASPEKQVLDANDRYLQNYNQRATDAYLYISTYTFSPGGAMIDYTWTAPTGNVFLLSMSGGFLGMDSNPYALLNTAQRVIFFRYLQKFIGLCLKNYNISNGL